MRDTNSFEQPKSYAEGVLYTLVNGVPVADGGDIRARVRVGRSSDLGTRRISALP